MSIQIQLQTATQEYQKLQADYSAAVQARQRLDAQLSENELVKKVQCAENTLGQSKSLTFLRQEFANLTAENEIYKQIGPVLVKQDQTEAKNNVDTRLEFIRGEMYVCPTWVCSQSLDERDRKRVEKQMNDLEDESEKKKSQACLYIVDTPKLKIWLSYSWLPSKLSYSNRLANALSLFASPSTIQLFADIGVTGTSCSVVELSSVVDDNYTPRSCAKSEPGRRHTIVLILLQ
jgi:prefoldin beta subunit